MYLKCREDPNKHFECKKQKEYEELVEFYIDGNSTFNLVSYEKYKGKNVEKEYWGKEEDG